MSVVPFPILQRYLCTFALWLGLMLSASAQRATNAERQTENALLYLTQIYEKEGFDFSSDIWQRELKPEMGKAVRMQMYKGNEYRICVSVSPQSQVEIEAHIYNSQGEKIESMIQNTEGSWGCVLHVKPPSTGVYLFTVRNSGGKQIPTHCAMISGYR